MLGQDTIIIGDWNSNAIWDNDYKKSTSHSEVISFLEKYDVLSLYHLKMNEKQGEKSKNTLAFRTDIDMAYHIDYFFVERTD